MATVLKFTNQGNPSYRNPGPFPSFVNVGAPYMATLSVPGFTNGFLVWLFSTPMIQNVQTSPQPSSPPPKQYQPLVEPKVDSLPSSLFRSSSSPSSSSGESLQASKEVDNKKMKNKKRANQVKISTNAIDVGKYSNQPRKVKFPCKICKGDHLL